MTGTASRPAAATAIPLVAVLVAAVNLRPAVTGVSPLFERIGVDLGLSTSALGLLATLPVICFGVFALAGTVLAQRFGEGPVTTGCMLVLAVSLLLRAAGPVWTLFAGTVAVGLAIGVANVVLPALIKRRFADRIPVVTALYTMLITCGAALGSGLAVPISDATGSPWRVPLALLAVPAALAFVACLPVVRDGPPPRPSVAAARPWRDRLAWAVTAMMGIQSLLAYVVFSWLPTIGADRGLSEAAAGALLSFSSVVQAAGSIGLPLLLRRLRDQRPAIVAVAAFTAAGLAGVTFAPVGGIWVWSAVLGVGQGAAFGLALTLIGLRSADAAGAAQLSGMAQCAGYVIAAVGPVGVGVMYDVTGAWTVPVVFLLGCCVLLATVCLPAGRDQVVGGRSAGGSG
ncbi:MAG: MFS transporter [Streptosporangiales bacterium]|nr:MFS transporter [Streptosporangiales bacterium]